MYIFFYTINIFDPYDIPSFEDSISCVKLLFGPFRKDYKELFFDDLDRDNFGE